MRTKTVALFIALAVSASTSGAFAQSPAAAPAAGAHKADDKKPVKGGKKVATPEPAPEPTPPPPPPGPPSLADSLTGEPKADYESGKVLFGDGDHANALVKFKSAFDKSKDVRLLWNMAACEKNLRHYAKALKLMRQYMTEGGDKLTEQDKAEGQELIKVMEPLTAKLRLNVTPVGSEIFIDDETMGPSPIEPTVVDIGTRKVRVRKDEFEDFTKEIPVGGAAEVAVDVNLVKIIHEGKLVIAATEGSNIAVDGKVVGVGSFNGVLPSGGHAVRVTMEGMLPFQSEVYIQDKESRNLTVTLEKEPSKGLPAWAWIAGGVVVAGGLGVGGYFVFKPQDKYEGPVGNLNPGTVQASRPFHF